MRIRAAEGKLALLLRCTRRTHLLRLVVPQQMHQCRHERIQVRLCLIEHDLCLTTDVVVRRHERIDHLLILLDASHFACLKPLRLNAQGGHAGWSYSAATCMYGCGAATLAAAARCSCVRVAGVAARSTPTVRGACRRRTEPRATRKAASGAGYDDASMRGVSVPENHTCFPSHVRPSRRNSAGRHTVKNSPLRRRRRLTPLPSARMLISLWMVLVMIIITVMVLVASLCACAHITRRTNSGSRDVKVVSAPFAM